MLVLFFLLGTLTAMLGAICGIGGGVIVKPVMDAMGVMSTAASSFLSGCTVLTMAFYSVLRQQLGRDKTPLPTLANFMAIAAAAGGILGKIFFQQLYANHVGIVPVVQSTLLFLITILTMIYGLCQAKIQTKNHCTRGTALTIGLLLGLLSAFLGIGGGPLNLIALSYFFSFTIRQSTQISLYLIFWSQMASLILNLFSRNVPEFAPEILVVLVLGGFLGAIFGRHWSRKLRTTQVQKLILAVHVAILLVCIYNVASAVC